MGVDLPNEILAMGAKSGLLEEARNEAMILHIIDVFLLERALPATVPQQQLVVGHFLHFVVGHCWAVACCCCCLQVTMFLFPGIKLTIPTLFYM